MNLRWVPAMHRRGSGLTLIELLMAIAALGLVGALFTTALQSPKSDRRTPPQSKALPVSDMAQDLAAQPSDHRNPLPAAPRARG
jgi:prepilin-type N-terminal cleavage/methylation domain-containing protein